MKNFKISTHFTQLTFFLVLILSMVSCSAEQLTGQQEINKETLLEEMITDSNLAAFLRITAESSRMIATGKVDLKGIDKLMDQPGMPNSLCEVNDDLLVNIKGAVAHKNLRCNQSQAIKPFLRKYPEFNNMSSEDRKKVIEQCKINFGMDYRGEELSNAALNERRRN